MHTHAHTHSVAVTPPLFATYIVLPEKKVGGVTTRTRAFASQLRPPLPRIHVGINEALLCSRRQELLQSTCRGSILKDGRVIDHVHLHVAIFCKNSIAARLLPPAARLHSRMTCRIAGLREPSEISKKGQNQISNYFLHA